MVPVYRVLLRKALDKAVELRAQATDAERAELADIEPRAHKLLESPAPTPAAPARVSGTDEMKGPEDLRIDWDTVSDIVDGIMPGVGPIVTRGPQLYQDVAESITRTPLHAKTVFAEQWDLIKDHWLEIMNVMAALVAAEIGVAILGATPDPTMGTKVAAIALQALLIAFAIHAAHELGSQAGAYASAWWANVQAAKGDVRMLDAAALNFARMIFSLVQAIGAALGFGFLSRRIRRAMGPDPAGKPRPKGDKSTDKLPAKTDKSPSKPHAKEPIQQLSLAEYRVERNQIRVETHRASTGWTVEVKAPLPEGRRAHDIGTGHVKLDQHGAPIGGPSFTIDKEAVVNGVNGKVQIYQGNNKLSATDVVLDESIAAFKKEFGHAPETLPGGLAWENKLNFQRSYATAMQKGLTHDAACQVAIREISFGRSRAARGYDRFSVEATDMAEVDLGGSFGVRRVPTTVKITARRSK
jgi:hypothetical protein